ncbi:MAG: putative cobaltochelatase [Candidatus Methanospirare jalkutatii]|nr:MAG: putative cobaltochelatase [Candidatus Methanospirare jalkutatii]
MTHHIRRKILPFTAIVGQEDMKLALILNAINPAIGGVLIRGEKGTAKSTAVRALAELLPEIEVVRGCPFNCNPYDEREMCDACYERKKRGETLEVVRRKMPVVELPLGATEERVVGTLDVERAIKEGIKALEPGILADANRGILYIDEVNLLDDHVADILLDAAAMGVNVVEREGISVAHPSKFILIGTMNPEEGELRPQLLDRFGLQVEVESIEDVEKRVEIARAVERFEADPEGFAEAFKEKQEVLKARILRAKALLKSVSISDDLLRYVARTCVELGIKTHRAEIVVARTAKTIAAFNGRTEVIKEDVERAMLLALPHRMRRRPFEPLAEKQKIEELLQKHEHVQEKHEHYHEHNPHNPHNPHSHDSHDNHEHKHNERNETEEHSDGEGESSEQKKYRNERSEVFRIGEAFSVDHLMPRKSGDRAFRKPHGRRVRTLSARSVGRYFRARMANEVRDIAIDATIRAAAPHQKKRSPQRTKIVIKEEDLREKVRVGKTSIACVFVVDASGSMGAMKRMESAKGAVFSLLINAYQHRDKVGLVAFRGENAEVLLPLCSSFLLAKKMLEELPTGGRTPLAAGLAKGLEMLLNECRKNRDVIPMLVLISDGRANVPLNKNGGSGGKGAAGGIVGGIVGGMKSEILRISEKLLENGIRTVVIDAERSDKSLMRLGFCREIAEHSGGKYYHIADLTADKVYSVVSREHFEALENFKA